MKPPRFAIRWSQIDEYLAAIERDSARARKEEELASADLAAWTQVKTELSTKLSAQQMELESLADRRQRVEEDSEGPPSRQSPHRGRFWMNFARTFRARRPAAIRWKKSFRIGLTPLNR